MHIAADMGDTTTASATTTAVQQLPNDNGNLRASHVSLGADSVGSSCPLSHQYHYIQYPAHYFQSSQPLPPQAALQAAPIQCHCPCSCGSGGVIGQSNALRNVPTLQQQQRQQQQQQQQQDGQLAVAVIVHQQSGEPSQLPQPQTPLKTSQSAQSLLNHSYQALQQVDINGPSTTTTTALSAEQKRLNIFDSSSCDCDLECTCGFAAAAAERALMKHKQQCNLIADAMLGADEITVSESDNNSTMIKTSTSSATTTKATATKAAIRKKQLSVKRNVCCDDDDDDDDNDGNNNMSNIDDVEACALPEKNCNEIYHDNELEGAEYCIKSNSTITGSIDDHRPPLPPRPPPARARNSVTNSIGHRHGTGIKKYVVWCLICGGFSCLLGVLFLGVYFMLHSYTITMGNFETIPTFVPATLLIMSGVCVMSLARRRNRYSYLIKLSGACGLVTALTCALVTVTTTVLHMSRLQALRECEYAQKTRTCTCYSDMIESQVDRVDKEGVRLVFDSLSDCGVVHGSLYSCLRAIFGLSVAGVLISVFSCMLVYQLLSHERKKMYWEQLELRCRSLYASQAPPPNMAAMAAAAATGRMVNCRCCEQCHAHRQLQMPLQAAPYPWDDVTNGGGGGNGVAGVEQRFWATQPPGNFYSPNPGGEEHAAAAAAAAAAQSCRGHNGVSVSNERTARSSGWSWPRMPWQRNTPVGSRRFRQTATSPDSQYGFSSTSDGNMLIEEPMPVTVAPHGGPAPFNVVPNALPYGVWGPPPPYSDPNSPARRGYYQYLQPPNSCLGVQNPNAPPERLQASQSTSVLMDQRHSCQHQSTMTLERPDSGLLNSSSTACLAATTVPVNSNGRQAKRQHGTAISGGGVKAKASEYENTNTPSDSDGGGTRERCSNTLPTRKLKKRIEVGAKSIGPNNQTSQRPNVQQVFAEANGINHSDVDTNIHNGADADDVQSSNLQKATQCRTSGNGVVIGSAGGVENTGYQCSADSNGAIAIVGHNEGADVSESEVYFADVSSCCNMSVKNDNYYEDANQHHHHQRQHQLQQQHHHHQHQHSNCSHSSSSNQSAVNNNNEDYLAQRFGRRENSVRSRLPFPQTRLNDDYESSNLNVPTIKNVAMEQQQLQKDISRQSMCSIESEAKTEFTDLSPSTPCGNQLPPPPANFASDKTSILDVTSLAHHQQQQQKQQQSNFVASFPYASAESQCLEAHRRSTKNIHELMLNNESHYEVINDARSYQQLPHANGGVSVANVTQQRPTNLPTKSSTRAKSRSREQLDNNNQINYQAEREWSDGGGGSGGGLPRTKRL